MACLVITTRRSRTRRSPALAASRSSHEEIAFVTAGRLILQVVVSHDGLYHTQARPAAHRDKASLPLLGPALFAASGSRWNVQGGGGGGGLGTKTADQEPGG
jgi:hypothetical protein